MKRMFPLLAAAVFCLFSFTPMIAQDAQSVSITSPGDLIPNPLKLEPAWFDYIENAPQDEMPDKISSILENIEKATENLSEENREKAAFLLDDIRRNLKNYAKILSMSLPIIKPPHPIAKKYSIEDVIEVYRKLQKREFELKTKMAENEDLLKQKDQLQKNIDVTKQEYDAAPSRSSEKLFAGMKRISFRPAMQVIIKKISIADKNIEIINLDIGNLEDEIKTAKKRLFTTSEELLLLARSFGPEKLVWNNLKKERQDKEAELRAQFSEETTIKAEAFNQYLNLQIMEIALKEIKAATSFFRSEIIYTISNLIQDSEKVDLETLITSEKDWREKLLDKKNILQDLSKQIDRIRQSAVKQIPLEEQKVDDEKISELLNKIIELSQSNFLLIEAISQEIKETIFILNVLVEKEIVLEGKGRQWLRLFFEVSTGAFENAKKKFGRTIFYIGPHSVTTLTIVRFFLIMIVTWWISKLVRKAINTFARHRKGLRKAIIYRLTRLLHYLILVVGLLIALTSIGFDFSNLIIIAGALGVGIGFGMQNIFNNFISGIIILFQSQLKVGDFVELDVGLRGEIRDINFRSTVITTNDGVDVIVPNAEMLSNKIVNWTLRDPYRRVHVPFSVAYGSDLDKVTKVIIEAAKEQPSTLKKIGVKEPTVFISQFGDNSVEMELVVWVDEKWAKRSRQTTSQYLRMIQKILIAHNFTIPFPQRDIHIIDGLDKVTETDK